MINNSTCICMNDSLMNNPYWMTGPWGIMCSHNEMSKTLHHVCLFQNYPVGGISWWSEEHHHLQHHQHHHKNPSSLIALIVGSVFLWINHGWIIPTSWRHKITTTNPKINVLGFKVGGPRTNTAFTIYSGNIKRRTHRSTNRILPTP